MVNMCAHTPAHFAAASFPTPIAPLQFFLYAVPAQQQPDLAHVRLPVPPPAPQLPWMAPQRGVCVCAVAGVGGHLCVIVGCCVAAVLVYQQQWIHDSSTNSCEDEAIPLSQ